MTQYLILTVNREIEEREKILKALEPFQTIFEIFQAENASEAEQKLINLMENEEQLSLIKESCSSFSIRLMSFCSASEAFSAWKISKMV